MSIKRSKLGKDGLRLDGHPSEDKRWTTTRRSPSVPPRKGQTMGLLASTTPLGSPWPSQNGLETTQPRPILFPQDSYKRPLPYSTSELHLPPSNSNLIIGSINQRDQYTMSTPLNTPLDADLPLPPPQVSSGRLGAIITVYVESLSLHLVQSSHKEDLAPRNAVTDARQNARRPFVLRHGYDHCIDRLGHHRDGSSELPGDVLGSTGVHVVVPW